MVHLWNLLLMTELLSVLKNSVLEWKWLHWRSYWLVLMWSLLLMNSVLEWKWVHLKSYWLVHLWSLLLTKSVLEWKWVHWRSC